MLAAINFDNQASLKRAEVCEVWSDCILTPEFNAELPVAYSVP